MPSRTFTDYFSDAKRLQRRAEAESDGSSRTIRISIAASFTTRGLKEILTVTCADAAVRADVFESDYNQHWQNLLDAASPLYAHNPELIIVLLDIRDIMGEQYWTPYGVSDDDRRKWVETQTRKLASVVESTFKLSPATVLLHNFETPAYSPLGILEDKQAFGVREAVQALNARLREMAKSNPRLFVFDYDLFCSTVGKSQVRDQKMYFLGDLRLHWTHMPDLCREYLAYIQPLLSLTRKCIVLDLDNTLWGGIAGEDGIEGIQLGPTPEGRPFWELQKLLLALWQRGVILAINSRNNPDDALKVVREHPCMVLREEHFAAVRINWDDKAENLRQISDELRLGLDSLVFMDDDHATRQRIQSAFPQVLVVDLPEDAALYPTALMKLNVFNTLQFTEEDRSKGVQYADHRKRREAEAAVTLEEHLSSLETVVTMQTASRLNIPRIAQLTQKTNQFNMTTRRYLEADISRFAEDPNWHVVCCRVQDKFGDSGITGVAMVEKSSSLWRIDTLLLSCRVIGRGIEDALLSYLVDIARTEGATTMVGEFISTPKNSPAQDFYHRKSFVRDPSPDGIEQWSYSVIRPSPLPAFLSVRVSI